jgi:hypothetical protein
MQSSLRVLVPDSCSLRESKRAETRTPLLDKTTFSYSYTGVGTADGARLILGSCDTVGSADGCAEGRDDGLIVGAAEGSGEGYREGFAVGMSVGLYVGSLVGDLVVG